MNAKADSRRGPLWFGEFEVGPTAVVYRKTGARVPFSRSLAADLQSWLRYFFAVQKEAARTAPAFTMACAPDRGRPWYLIWPVMRLAGGRLAPIAQADVLMHFEDATWSDNAPPATRRTDARLINFNCTDVSKSRIAAAFEAAFGYPLALEPTRHTGPAVEKSELNGAHDGRTIECPAAPRPGHVYQRLIDNRSQKRDARGRELVEDFRCPTVGGKPICVFIKRRPIDARFGNDNSEVELALPEQLFSVDELSRIGDFARRLGLDWGGVDVLRDKGEGRLYIVDANKTDMGPPIALPLADKLAATRMLARAFRAYVKGE
ncbi:MAG: hypothetical protein JNJ73_18315 [Hyphomonadaceae bacterium]|nr:hypothetical protein [Hyphomonadaceae bacterium]